MKFKRILALVVTVLAVLCIVACGSEEATGGTAHTHSFGEWETTKEASCEEKGSEVRKCACGAEENQDIPAKGHTEVIDKGYDATATENGLTDGSHCGVCNKTLTEQKVIYSGSKGLTYITVSDMTCRIAGIGSCTDTNIVIPEYIDGYKVTHIEPRAFANCTNITSIIVPAHITSIGEKAFEGCTGLTSITLPFLGATKDESKNANMEYIFGEASESLTTIVLTGGTVIGDYAFEGYTGLTSITIPESVTSIGDDAFDDCTNLSSVYITDIAAWCNIDFTTLYAMGHKVINNPLQNGAKLYLNNELVTNLTLPNSITSITDGVFYGYTSLTNITIPDSVTSIGKSAFDGCTALKSISIPNSVTSIGITAFRGCTGLTSISIPDSVTEIASSAFNGCTALASITLPNSITEIGDGVFIGCTGLTSITIPNSATSIGYCAFDGCTGLASISIPDSVTFIDKGAFRGCTGLTSITIPDSVTEIGAYAFKDCTGLTNITIPDSVTKIGGGAFEGCTNLTIYCEAESMPSGWDYNWNTSNCPVQWGYIE